jgi:REP element-mobilizing transposase RayT
MRSVVGISGLQAGEDVKKYRRGVFDGDVINQLRTIFAKVCADFEAQLIEMDGEGDHVHKLSARKPAISIAGGIAGAPWRHALQGWHQG